jgi:hypothetical protein
MEQPGQPSVRWKADWPLRQPAGIERAKRPRARLRRRASQPRELALAAGYVPASPAQAAAPGLGRAYLRLQVGLGLPFAKAVAPGRQQARARQVRRGAGQWRILGEGAAERPSEARRQAFRLQAGPAALEASKQGAGAGPAPAIRIFPRSPRSPRRAHSLRGRCRSPAAADVSFSADRAALSERAHKALRASPACPSWASWPRLA